MNEPAMKMLIVDDEPMARRRIRSFNLEPYGFEIVGEAENGEQAWTMIRELAPDIVVADIGMPVLNGLDLLKRVGEMAAPPKFILLTCYEDFDKIQVALRFGAHDYITKLLLAEEDFIACLNKAADNIRQERRHLQKAVRQLLLELLFSGSEARTSQEQLAALSFPSRQHQLALLRFAPEHTRALLGIAPLFEASEDACLSLILPVEPGLWALLAVTSDAGGAAFHSWTTSVLRRGYNACKAHGIPIVQTLSDIRAGLLHLPRSLAECRALMDEAFHAPMGAAVTAHTVSRLSAFPPERFDGLLKDCRAAVEREDPAAAAETLLRWLDEAEHTYAPEPAQLRHMGAALAGCLEGDFTWRQEDGTVVPLRERLQTRIEAARHMTGVREAVEETAERLRAERLPARGIRTEIREALRFIEERFREEIDLPAAARHVSLSPSWFGTLFRNEMGRSFFDYLQDYRLEQARELLLQTDLKIYEIAAQTGIPNSRYFSRLFADKYKASPQDFRSRLRGTRCRS